MSADILGSDRVSEIMQQQ